MTTRDPKNVDQLDQAIRRLIEMLIAHDQRVIGVSQSVTDAQTDLRDALKRAFGLKVEERAEP